jgi:hypothetical protein
MADVPAGLVSAYYEILQAGAGSYDPERLRSILVSDLDFEGPIAGHVRGADRFTRGVAGFIETQQGIRFVQQVVTHDGSPDGSATVQMWSAADPHSFPVMQITIEQPGDAGQHGQILLSGTAQR